jgi:hypothetical protein
MPATYLSVKHQVLHIADALHNRPRDPLCVKALQRRAAALQGLDQHGRAVADLEKALEISGGGDREIQEQLRKAQLLREEGRRQRRAAKAVGCQEGGSSEGGASAEVRRLSEVGELAAVLGAGSKKRQHPGAQQIVEACEKLTGGSWCCMHAGTIAAWICETLI